MADSQAQTLLQAHLRPAYLHIKHPSFSSMTSETSSDTPSADTLTAASASKRLSRKVENKRPQLWNGNSQQFVTLYSGNPDASPFRTYREYAIHRSPVLKATFDQDSDFIENMEDVKLSDSEDPTQTQCRCLVKLWILADQLLIPRLKEATISMLHTICAKRMRIPLDLDQILDQKSLEPVPKEKVFFVHSRWLTKLWVLADKLLIPKLQNTTIRGLDALATAHQKLPSNLSSYVCKNTAKDSPLRKWFVFEFSFDYIVQSFENGTNDFPREMLLEMIVLLTTGLLTMTRDQARKTKNMTDFLVPETS
ncbi:uncharacterized protein PAC_01021 [Phialocephala subalpina]|uniref:BTB domain-containing protein n=1 Tax=Phialocephala subalpina TaxID=576137 RepID=A0A1L7WEF7_9HELO|nr:uncharacterized protein PAC_01021 [Phialocephala subalpina]